MSIFCLNLRRFPYPGTAALYLCPRVLGPCLWLCLQESLAHSWGCGLQVIRLAVHRVLPDFKNCTISCILSHIITTSPVILSCRCRISLLCVGHLRILHEIGTSLPSPRPPLSLSMSTMVSIELAIMLAKSPNQSLCRRQAFREKRQSCWEKRQSCREKRQSWREKRQSSPAETSMASTMGRCRLVSRL